MLIAILVFAVLIFMAVVSAYGVLNEIKQQLANIHTTHAMALRANLELIKHFTGRVPDELPNDINGSK
jgi:hypothetical protein